MRSDCIKAFKSITTLLVALTAAVSSARGATFTVGGTVSGLKASESVTLVNNKTNAAVVKANGTFTFSISLATGKAYSVTVEKQPAGQICTVTNGSGTVGTKIVNNVKVTCANAFTIGGTVTGLNLKDKLVLLDNGGDALTVEALTSSETKSLSFTFKTPVATGAPYAVTVGTPPTDQVCAVSKGASKVGTSNVTAIAVACTIGYTVGGSVTGLSKGKTVTLLDNKGNALTLSGTASGTVPFTFTDALANKAKYAVTVGTQPAGETCTVTSHGSGTISAANVTLVAVSCKLNPLTIGGTIGGLEKSGKLTLLDNGGNATLILGTGSPIKFTFSAGIASGGKYDVTIETQPAGQVCTVSKGSGTVGTTDVISVDVTCVTGYTISGAVSGLKSGTTLILLDNGGSALAVKGTPTGIASFTFATELPSKATFDVTVGTQPAGLTCTVTNPKGAVGTANVTNIAVTCSASATTYSVSGTVTGLSTGQSVVLQNNGGSNTTITFPSTTFAYANLANAANYAITVLTPPTGDSCTVTGGSNGNGSGTIAAANVSGIVVACTPITYSVSGSVTGMTSGQSIVIQNNGGSNTTIANPASTFSFTKLANSATYAITVLTPPTGDTCTVTGGSNGNGSGTIAAANVSGIVVACTPITYSVSGTVTGMTSGQSIVIQNNGGSNTTIANPASTFSFTKLANSATYAITVLTPPTGDTCTVTGGSNGNGSGTIAAANVTGIVVNCTAAATTYTVSGSVSGMTSGQSVVIQNNGGSNTTIANPATTFSFTKLANDASYAITVLTPPTGDTCTVTGGSNGDGSGTIAAANVTNIVVACSSSGGGGGGGSPFWIPYTETSISAGPPAGSTGLFVIPSDKLSTNPTPQWITTDAVQTLGTGGTISVNNGVASYSLQVLMYADTNSSGVTQIYGLSLSDTSSVPTPVRIGTFSLASPQQICLGGSNTAQTDLTKPESLFAVIQVGTPTECFGTGSTFEVVHYLDTTGPVTVSINTTQMDTLYQNGKLSGLLVFDSTKGALDVYADDTFTSPKQEITGLQSAMYVGGAEDIATFGTAEVFYFVTTPATVANPNGVNYLYRIDGSTQAVTLIQNLAQSSVNQGVIDDTNLYYIDSTSTASSTTDAFYQVALAGGTPKLLYTTPAFDLETSGTLTGYSLIGSNDSVLVFQYYTGPLSSNSTKNSATLYSVPVGTTTTTPTTLANYPAGTGFGNNIAEAFLATSTGSITGDVLFATVQTATAVTLPTPTTTIQYHALSIPLNGDTAPTPIANSVYAPLSFVSLQYISSVFQVTGITDTNGGYGGGTANQANVGTLADTPFTTVGGKDYVFPAGYSGELFGISDNGIAAGVFGNGAAFDSGAATTLNETPAAADLSTNFLWTGAPIANTFVFPY